MPHPLDKPSWEGVRSEMGALTGGIGIRMPVRQRIPIGWGGLHPTTHRKRRAGQGLHETVEESLKQLWRSSESFLLKILHGDPRPRVADGYSLSRFHYNFRSWNLPAIRDGEGADTVAIDGDALGGSLRRWYSAGLLQGMCQCPSACPQTFSIPAAGP